MAVVGFYLWTTARGAPGTGAVGLESDPLPGYANTLLVSDTDAYGNDRSASLDLVLEGSVISIAVGGPTEAGGGRTFNAVVNDTPTAGAVYGFPFVVRQDFDTDDEPSDGAPIAFAAEAAGDPAGWPTVAELAQALNLGTDGATDWADTLDRVMASAIARVKSDVGDWSEGSDAPTSSQAQAALRMGFLMWTSPESPSLGLDPSYRGLLSGQRRRFAIA